MCVCVHVAEGAPTKRQPHITLDYLPLPTILDKGCFPEPFCTQGCNVAFCSQWPFQERALYQLQGNQGQLTLKSSLFGVKGGRSFERMKNFSLWRKNKTCLQLLEDFLSPWEQEVKLKSKQSKTKRWWETYLSDKIWGTCIQQWLNWPAPLPSFPSPYLSPLHPPDFNTCLTERHSHTHGLVSAGAATALQPRSWLSGLTGALALLLPAQKSQVIQPRNVGSKLWPMGLRIWGGAERWSLCFCLSPVYCSIWPPWRYCMGLKLSELASKNIHTKTFFVFIWNSDWIGCPTLIWQPCMRPNNQLCLLRLWPGW